MAQKKSISNPLLQYPEFTATEMHGNSLMVLLKSGPKSFTDEVKACTRAYTDADTTKRFRDEISAYSTALVPELMTVALLQSNRLAPLFGCIRTVQIDGTVYTLRELHRDTYQHKGHRIVGCTCVVIGTRDAV
jgi:hypothetical protein